MAADLAAGSSDRGAAAPPGRTALQVSGLSKTFPGTRALKDVSFGVEAGSVHALIGGNGSGKSTLIKTLAGVHRGDPGGTVTVAGQDIAGDAITSSWARAAGIHFIHQELGLFEPLSVAENVVADGGYPSRGGVIRWRRLHEEARRALDRVGSDLDPDTPVGTLRPALRTMVAIARALREEERTSVLVLDEPTAPLPEADVQTLLGLMRRMAGEGVAVLFVTHRLEEVLEVADAVTALRDGEHVETKSMAGVDEAELMRLIVGRPLASIYPESGTEPVAKPLLEVRGLSGGAVRGVDFELSGQEVLGIGGLVGSGRSTLLRLLYGLEPLVEGELRVDGAPYVPASPRRAIEHGFAYVPEDRAGEGAFMPMSVLENLSIANLTRYRRFAWLSGAAERRDGEADIEALSIRAPGPRAPLYQLSGGNQQKAIVARWLRRRTRVLLLDEPTSGVDIASRAEIYRLIRDLADSDAAVLLVSSDYEELAGVCDRVLVMAEGRIVAEARHQVDRHWIAERAHQGRAATATGGGG